VKMKNGEFLRPVERLVPLELTTEPDAPDQRTGVRRSAEDSSSDINPGPEKFLQSKYGRSLKRRI
ncbi:hypothetical protein NPIL_388441, partial [Nephila pilipes]